MNKPRMIVTLFLLLVACSPTPTIIPSTLIPNPAIQNPLPASPVLQSETPAASTQPTPTDVDAGASETTEDFWFQVTSPLDEAVVNTPQVEVIGSAPAETVISVNDEIVIVGDDQQFKVTVSLEEGPNLIEMIASDVNENETSLLLTVTYEP